ncbi:hypothetical protein LEP1GSC047_0017 [Leptospira inadai serovar Lyme str. 10]|uniref:Uncharacterized protein n=1 Tax=Leptospira inadai serovar Lyme str. 10 TaxID=1049790 RepID=V6HF78_9LEPT|nr:hypothetical protein LEP1GSC047_0017 [Leptospira inadai serovar Lyme str. 10]
MQKDLRPGDFKKMEYLLAISPGRLKTGRRFTEREVSVEAILNIVLF